MSYGRRPEGAKHWREKMLREVGSQLDPTRTHFLGKVPYAGYKRILQVSAAHVYLTYPFVLSWSMLEAMATGCLVIGSDTAPVLEVIRDGQNGVTVDFFDDSAIAARVAHALDAPERHRDMRERGRRFVLDRYRADTGLMAYEALLRESTHLQIQRSAA